MKFTKSVLKAMRQDIDAALAVVAKKHGITLSIGNISFDANSFRTTLSAKGSEDTNENEQVEFLANAGKIGLDNKAYGAIFSSNGSDFEIVGVVPRRRKYPISARKVSNGGSFKFTMDAIPQKYKTWG